MEASPQVVHRIKQHQGIGDAIALTSVLRHLRHYDPDCRIELVVTEMRENFYCGLADEISANDDFSRPPTQTIRWQLADESYSDCPSTYVERHLLKEMGIKPVPELWRYSVAIQPQFLARAQEWVDSLARTRPKLALCHFRGESAKSAKNLDDYQGAAVVRSLESAGYDVLIWDLDEKTKLPDNGFGSRIPEIIDPPTARVKHAGISAALISIMDLVVGVDSGPLHLAAAVNTPFIGLWPLPAGGECKHPLHCICPAPRSAHVMLRSLEIVEYWRWGVFRPIDVGLEFFNQHYRHVWALNFAEGVSQVLAEGI